MADQRHPRSPGPAPAVAAVRLAVRSLLANVARAGSGPHADGPVIVACSGGADSLALLTATVFEAGKLGLPVLGATVDHGLQPDSADRAAAVVDQMKRLGVTDTVSVRVHVDPAGQGIEAAARRARYDVLRQIAVDYRSTVVLLGHTRDDQAETVLLGLTRGSGGRSLAGMPSSVDDLFHRPLLHLTREQTEEACRAEGIDFWSDPHNADPRFTRSRIRHRVLPLLEAELGPGVAAALARTADMLRADVEALDRIARAWFAEHGPTDRFAVADGSETIREGGPVVRDGDETFPGTGPEVRLDARALATLDEAIRLRVLRLAAIEAGCPPGELFRVHVLAVDELVCRYTGQKRIELPGPVHAVRSGPVLRFSRP